MMEAALKKSQSGKRGRRIEQEPMEIATKAALEPAAAVSESVFELLSFPAAGGVAAESINDGVAVHLHSDFTPCLLQRGSAYQE